MMPKHATLAVSIGLSTALLAACGGVPQDALPTPAATTTEAPAPEPPKPTRVSTNPEPARRALLPVAELRGMTSEQVSVLLGLPQFQRNEAPVELWQYRGEGCVLHVFLYRTREGLRVQYAEARARVLTTVADRALSGTPADECLAKLAAAQPGAAS